MFPKDLALAAPHGALTDESNDADSAWTTLERWHDMGIDLSFVYARSGGGLMQSGTVHISRLAPMALTLAAADCKLMVVLIDATYTSGPQLFFTADFTSRFTVDGIAIALANHDWLFLSASAPGTALTLGTISIGHKG